jgi:predicted RNase H-like HicB family nuclease
MSLRLTDPRNERTDAGRLHIGEGVWTEKVAFGTSEVESSVSIPVSLVERYSSEAVRHAQWERLEDGDWYASIEGFEGVWASGPNPEDVGRELREVVFDWAIMKMVDGDLDIPALGDMDLRRPA